MEAWYWLGGFAALLVVWIICLLKNNKHSVTDKEFRLAGVVVNFWDATVKIKRKVYPIGVIKSWRSESEYGKKLFNGSFSYLHLNDFKRPVHTITFLTPNAAKIFLQRLNLAIERCYEYQARNNAAAAE